MIKPGKGVQSGERAQESIKKVGVSSSHKNKTCYSPIERKNFMSWEMLDKSMSKEEEKKFSSKPKLCLKKGGKMFLILKLKRRMFRL